MAGATRRAAAGAALIGLLAAPEVFPVVTAEPGRPGSVLGDLAGLMERVAERVSHYYDRVTSVVCVETVSQQELRFSLKPWGKPRETVYDLMVVREPPADGETESRIQLERKLRTVNGRPAGRHEPPGCTDLRSIAVEPLSFLLPKYQAAYQFSPAAGAPADGPPGSVIVGFRQRRSDPVTVTWDGLCFDARGGGIEGRIWLEESTYDVLQLEMRLTEPFRIPPPPGLMFEIMPIRVERSEVTIRFARVEFDDPEETLLLPESMVTLTQFRGVPSLLTTQTFRGFRRFLSETKIKGAV